MPAKRLLLTSLFVTLLCPSLFAANLKTNTLDVHQAPIWVTVRRLERIVDQIQNKLEWDIRRIPVYWYTDSAQFIRKHGYDESVLAFAHRKDNSVHLGPGVTPENFESVFGHELVHIILYQKYKDAIPSWLEEGLANYISKHGKVDYAWLRAQPEVDVRTFAHPYKIRAQNLGITPRFSYMAGTAVIEMIAARCSISDLLQLSVGKNLETYLATYCGISDVNTAFKAWVLKKRARKP